MGLALGNGRVPGWTSPWAARSSCLEPGVSPALDAGGAAFAWRPSVACSFHQEGTSPHLGGLRSCGGYTGALAAIGRTAPVRQVPPWPPLPPEVRENTPGRSLSPSLSQDMGTGLAVVPLVGLLESIAVAKAFGKMLPWPRRLTCRLLGLPPFCWLLSALTFKIRIFI